MSKDKFAMDPEQLFSHLPQPYRMICKIIEFEIIDPSWLEITRRHPELSVGSDGKCITVKRNFMLNTVGTPKFTKPVFSKLYFTSIRGDNGKTFCTDLEGKLHMFSGHDFECLGSVNALEAAGVQPSNVCSPFWISSLNSIASADGSLAILVCVSFICKSAATTSASAVAANAGKKGAQPTKSAAPSLDLEKPEQTRKCKNILVLANCSEDHVSLDIVDLFSVEIEQSETDETIHVDIDLAHRLLLFTAQRNGSYVFPIRIPVIDAASMQQSDRTGDQQESPDTLTPFAKLPRTASPFNEKLLKAGMHLLVGRASKISAFPWCFSTEPLAGKWPNEPIDQPLTNSSMEVAFLFEEATELLQVDLRPLFSQKTPGLDAAPVGAGGTAPSAKKSKSQTDAPQPNESDGSSGKIQITALASWLLTAPVSCYSIDSTRRQLALGLSDGSVQLFDVQTRSSLTTLCAHPSGVTALRFCPFGERAETQGLGYLISGAEDGTLCFSLLSNLESKKLDMLSRPRNGLPDSKYRNQVLSIRQDQTDVVVQSIDLLGQDSSLSLCLVTYANQLVGLYELETGELLGQLKLTISNGPHDPKWIQSTRRTEFVRGSSSANKDEGSIVASILQSLDPVYSVAETLLCQSPAPKRSSKSGKFVPLVSSDHRSLHVPISLTCVHSFGFTSLYRQDNHDDSIFALYSTEDILCHFFPFLSSVIHEVAKFTTPEDVVCTLTEIFSLLTAEEKLFPLSGESLPKSRELELKQITGIPVSSADSQLSSVSRVTDLGGGFLGTSGPRGRCCDPMKLALAAIEEVMTQQSNRARIVPAKSGGAAASTASPTSRDAGRAVMTATGGGLLSRMKRLSLEFEEQYAAVSE